MLRKKKSYLFYNKQSNEAEGLTEILEGKAPSGHPALARVAQEGECADRILPDNSRYSAVDRGARWLTP